MDRAPVRERVNIWILTGAVRLTADNGTQRSSYYSQLDNHIEMGNTTAGNYALARANLPSVGQVWHCTRKSLLSAMGHSDRKSREEHRGIRGALAPHLNVFQRPGNI